MNSSQTPIKTQLTNLRTMTHWHCLPRTRERFKRFSHETWEIETTATRDLGSLLANTGAIQASQALASEAYDADITRFVTAGTTQANEIVTNAYLSPGDIVLCDWGCHASHHAAIRMAGAFVNYLQPYVRQEYSIVGTVPLATILSTLRDLQARGLLGRVKMLILTHSTYYGLYYKNLEDIMREVLKLVPNMVFLIDEAWFAHAPFHPVYRPFTAMATARRLQGNRPRPDAAVRVISTSSAHKGLPAPRQSSVINIVDERFDDDAFEQAYRSFATTSYSLPIVSGLAQAIKFSKEQGKTAIDEALASAMMLRDRLHHADVLSLGENELIPEHLRSVVALDMTKVGYLLPNRISGEEYKRRLHDEESISIQMVTLNTALAMSVMGTREADVETLVRGTARIVNAAPRSRVVGKMPPIPVVGRFAKTFSPYEGIGDLRSAYYAARESKNAVIMPVHEIGNRLQSGETIALATAFMPYPPGQQMAVHGHHATPEATDFVLSCLEQGYEVHGVRNGAMRVFHESALQPRSPRLEQDSRVRSRHTSKIFRGSSREAHRE